MPAVLEYLLVYPDDFLYWTDDILVDFRLTLAIVSMFRLGLRLRSGKLFNLSSSYIGLRL